MCTVKLGQQEFKKVARDVEERKSNRRCSLAFLGNLLPKAREETSCNIISCVKFQ